MPCRRRFFPARRPGNRVAQRLDHYDGLTSELLRRVPVRLWAFDILAVDGVSVTERSYLDRRELLEAMCADAPAVPIVPHFLARDVSPNDMLAVCREHSMEGIVVKRIDSPYRPGRSAAWIKCPVRATADVIILGWWPAAGPGNARTVGGLILGGHNDSGQLVSIGQVSSGLSDRERRRLFDLFSGMGRKTPPAEVAKKFSGARWVRPELVGEVAYREYSARQGFRHPSWKGLRDMDVQAVWAPRDINQDSNMSDLPEC